MALFTYKQQQRLLLNGNILQAGKDHVPVLKLFFPGTDAVWLLTELDPDANDVAYGLCDLGFGYPELMPFSLSDLAERSRQLGIPLQLDHSFQPTEPISVYAKAAVLAGGYTEDATLLAWVQNEACGIAPSQYKLTL